MSKKEKKLKKKLKKAKMKNTELVSRLAAVNSTCASLQEALCNVEDDCENLRMEMAEDRQSQRDASTVRRVSFGSDKTTTVTWMDGSETTVRCSSNDKFDPEMGFVMCLAKKQAGNKNIRKLYKRIVE